MSDGNTKGFGLTPFHLAHQSGCNKMFILFHSSYLIAPFVIRRDCGNPVRLFKAHPRAVYCAIGAQVLVVVGIFINTISSNVIGTSRVWQFNFN